MLDNSFIQDCRRGTQLTQRILIAGGYGVVGSAIARLIRKVHKDIEIIIAGRNPEQGQMLVHELGHARTANLNLESHTLDLDMLEGIDLIIAALKDPADSLTLAAHARGIAHIGITKTADQIAPIVFAALRTPPQRPIALLGHWAAGIMTIIAQKLASQYSTIDAIELTALYDYQDPIGPMTAKDAEGFVGRALLRQGRHWSWVDAPGHARLVQLADGITQEALPMGVLDVPSLAAVTDSPDIRFDLTTGNSIGTNTGGKASHDLYIDIAGTLKSGETANRRTIISDPNGQAHLTALGVLVAIENILGWNGRPPAEGGIHLPETLVPVDAAIARIQDFGVTISETEL